MKFKGIEFIGIDQLINGKSERAVKLAWKNSLGHQITENDLPNFETVREEIEQLFNKYFATR